ncbi:hypothetical protein PSN45_004741 [Yamadazyma tenuis]|uniref:MPPN-domain-containing protein n=1 Tax=Candida tenuis (strain ATCC 10573 / BCRC 21748 / CBS 615 / JCM 9827 / NBRC 10315 / NRRL Y-1498 / VKM Y-70) TaxID=590646 RepID=G3B6Q2_CANTC|nr:MPPN-domain-containing protein [Yamadazyma tenuis ATCC 10573]XP_006687302.1 uncharacterized protein CANTEDRAFT_114302 [Yamadazyma tenuis ATCC 10573]EGV63508.1 MPPN-domain-containing protein [Yamadazyma tenuis ATCC 10573]EGV63509.1 hypothetical protein CANTEDRAFT_114302 [Yamadazyma tenuis ATCC 10573]WEJ97193.1 hypothetical protein PSN45_004741 [Yamadazyma tenuis]
MSVFTQQSQVNQTSTPAEEPSWSSYPVKRVIPNHITSKRKPGFQITTGKKNDKAKQSQSSNSFNAVSFGSPRKPGLESRISTASNIYDTTADVTKFDETINKTITDDLSIYEAMDDDMPPSRSIYDLNDEILLNLDKPNNHTDSFLNKDPKQYGNVFNRGEVDSSQRVEKKKPQAINPLENGESAILVFGYPEHIANQVIQYFQDFGTILEDFEMNKNKLYKTINNKQREKIISCLSGTSWVKITYDNPASAIEALFQNGMVFNGSLLGVIPYTKDAVEKLQNRKLGDYEDIGSGIEFKTSGFKTQEPDASQDLTNSNFSKLEVKDGSKLFLGPTSANNDNKGIDNKHNNENLGVVGNIMKYVFGFNEL